MDVLPVLTTLHFDNTFFPFFESIQFEFKRTFHYQQFPKYLETMCSFLNSRGGYLIFGIDDTRELVGVTIESCKIDEVLLRIDTIILNRRILGRRVDTNEIITITSKNVTTEFISNSYGKLFLVIKVVPIQMSDIRFQLDNGKTYYRLGASNFVDKNERFFTQSDVENQMAVVRQENSDNLREFRKTIESYETQLHDLRVQIQMYDVFMKQMIRRIDVSLRSVFCCCLKKSN
jgi:predicted HTH transcriptional regulator